MESRHLGSVIAQASVIIHFVTDICESKKEKAKQMPLSSQQETLGFMNADCSINAIQIISADSIIPNKQSFHLLYVNKFEHERLCQ